MHPDKQQVAAQVHHPAIDAHQGVDVAADEYRYGGRRQGVFEQDRGAGQVSAPGTERPACETVAAAGRRQRGRQFRQAQHHAQIHGADDHSGNQHAAEAAETQAQVPAGKISGDDVGHAEARQQYPARGAFLELARRQVVAGNRFVLHAAA